MTRWPSPAEQKQLLESVVNFARIRPTAIAVLRYLFAQAATGAAQNKDSKSLTAPAIRDACRNTGGPKTEVGVNNDLGHLRAQLKAFFGSSTGCREPIRVEIELHSHTLRFSRNRLACESIAKFWSPYFNCFTESNLFYPEAQFFRHRTGAYLRHPKANWRDQMALVSESLHLEKADLKPTYSFTASGMTTAVATLLECFHIHDADLRAEPMRAVADSLPSGKRHVIVLGAPTTSLELIESIELDLPMRTGRSEEANFYTVQGSKPSRRRGMYVDGIEEETEFGHDRLTVQKYALITRVEKQLVGGGYKHTPRVTTLIAGHSRCVQAVVDLLTSEEKILPLLGRLGDPLPSSFQALIKLRMLTKGGDLELADATPFHVSS